jgi:hypothetical protein
VCTYPSAHNTLKCAHPVFDTILHALLRCTQHQNLVTTNHQTKFTFTFTVDTMTHQLICTIKKGFILGTLHSPPPYLCIVLSASFTHLHTKFSNFFRKMRILYPHIILVLLGCILGTVLGPLNLYHFHGSILELLDFSIQYANQSHLKIFFWLHLNHIPINNMINIRYTLFK